MGPGIVGTNTRLGFSGMEVGPILDAAHALGRRGHRLPAGVVRRRARPPRRAVAPQRHRAAPGDPRAGAGRGAASSATPSRPSACAPTSWPRGSTARHDLVDVDAPDVLELFARHGLAIASMGRPAADDPALFQAAAAAGTLAADAPGVEPPMADRLERLVNLTATLLDTRRPLTLDELAERVEPRYPDDKTSRRRQFERDKETLRELGVPDHGRDGRRVRRRAGLPHPPRRLLPARALAHRARAGGAARRGHRGAPRGRRRPRGAGEAGRAGGRGRRHRRSPSSTSSPGLAVLFDAVGRRALGHVLVPRQRASPRPVRRRAPLRPLVRRRPRPRPATPPRLPGRPHRRRARAGTPTARSSPRRRRSGRVRPRRPAHLRRGPARRRARARRRPARRLGGRPARRGGGGGAPTTTARSWSSLPVVNRAAFRSGSLDLLDHAEVLDRRPSCAPTSSRGSTRSRAALSAMAGAGTGRSGPSAAPRRRERASDEPSAGRTAPAARPRAGAVDPRPPRRDHRRARGAVRGVRARARTRPRAAARCAACRRTPRTGSSTCR